MLCPVHLRFLATHGSAVAGGGGGLRGGPWNCRDAPEVTGASWNSRGCQQWPLRAGSTIPRGPGLAVRIRDHLLGLQCGGPCALKPPARTHATFPQTRGGSRGTEDPGLGSSVGLGAPRPLCCGDPALTARAGLRPDPRTPPADSPVPWV